MATQNTIGEAQRARLQHQLERGGEALGVQLGAGQTEALLDYVALLTRWNKAYNLTAVRAPEEMVTRHLLDALAVSPHIAHTGRMADVGSGPGIPGIMLAIAHPQLQLTMIDSNLKMTRFAAQAVRTLGLENASVTRTRVEAAAFDPFEQIISRAFAELGSYINFVSGLLAPTGRIWAMKGQWRESEAKTIPAGFEIVQNSLLDVPGLDAQRRLIEIQPNRGQA